MQGKNCIIKIWTSSRLQSPRLWSITNCAYRMTLLQTGLDDRFCLKEKTKQNNNRSLLFKDLACAIISISKQTMTIFQFDIRIFTISIYCNNLSLLPNRLLHVSHKRKRPAFYKRCFSSLSLKCSSVKFLL